MSEVIKAVNLYPDMHPDVRLPIKVEVSQDDLIDVCKTLFVLEQKNLPISVNALATRIRLEHPEYRDASIHTHFDGISIKAIRKETEAEAEMRLLTDQCLVDFKKEMRSKEEEKERYMLEILKRKYESG